jgi:O-acetyl-ADP-ribose deacetylase (regulator of RNase III)
VAFPSISTRIYGFPRAEACVIAVREVRAFLQTDKTLKRVVFVAFDSITYDVYQRALAART